MRIVRHPREIEPVIAVRAHHFRIAIVDFREELARTGREAADACAQGRLHVVADRQDLVLPQEGHVLGHGLGGPTGLEEGYRRVAAVERSGVRAKSQPRSPV